MKNYLFLADGFEEIEALATVDILRRGDMDLTTVSITDTKRVTGAHGIVVEADLTFKQVDFSGSEWLILPGGMPGAANLRGDSALCDLLKVHNDHGRIAAICASPAVVLAGIGLLDGRKATCYPGFEEELERGGATPVDKRVVVDGNIVTANGPSSAVPFALEILRISQGDNIARNVAEGMLID